MADEIIKTSIDDLVEYLYEHGETNASSLSTALNIGEDTIDAWVDALEKAGLIRVVNKFDMMFLSPTTAVSESLGMGKMAAMSGQAVRNGMSNQLESLLKEFRSYAASLERGLVDREERLLSKLQSMAEVGRKKEVVSEVNL